MSRRLSHFICLAGLFIACNTQAAAQVPAAVHALRVQDQRLAVIADRLLTANAALCRQTMPMIGLTFHSRDQYGDSATEMFALGEVSVATLAEPAPGKVARDDGLLAIESQAVAELAIPPDAPLRDAVFEALADKPADAPLQLTINGRDGSYDVQISPEAGCRALVEIRSKDAIGARSDGRVIQVNYGLAAAASDDELAVVFAHELAHIVLEHRRRLSDAGVSKGFFGEFGRNQRFNRQVEVEADRMTVHLLSNAGYDPAIAATFFRTELGQKAGGGLFRSSTYPSPEARAQLVEREIGQYLAAGGPSFPDHLLARRVLPFD